MKQTVIEKVIAFAAAALITAAGLTSCASKPTQSGKAVSVSARPSTATTTRIPVLMYHSILYEKGNILRIPKEKFETQMKWLYDNGYHTLSLDELYDAVSGKRPVPEKSVVLTFDDGYGDNYTNAFPILKKYHFKATVFMITSKIGDARDNYLTAEQIKEMDANGMRVECHTLSHPNLDKLSYQEQYKELSESKAALERLLDRKVNYIAYPSGKYNKDTIKAAQQLGFKICFKMNGGAGSVTDSRYEFPRAFVGENLHDVIKIVQPQ